MGTAILKPIKPEECGTFLNNVLKLIFCQESSSKSYLNLKKEFYITMEKRRKGNGYLKAKSNECGAFPNKVFKLLFCQESSLKRPSNPVKTLYN